jgi:hypothetical protein
MQVSRPPVAESRLSLTPEGTSRLDDKGEIQGEETLRVRVPMQETGTEQLVLVKKLL